MTNTFSPSIDGWSSRPSQSAVASTPSGSGRLISVCFSRSRRAVSAAGPVSHQSGWSENPTVKLRTCGECLAASPATAVLSSPPDRNSPTGTSAIRWSRTAASSVSRTASTTAARDRHRSAAGYCQNTRGSPTVARPPAARAR
jgi:hypothetical protein